tara:strand:- start:11835 stop:12143 length:309 start_codon:yes stop_codon:yes gene_type:complete
LIRFTGDEHHAAGSLYDQVATGPVALGTTQTKGTHRTDDLLGQELLDEQRVQSRLAPALRREIANHHIGLLRQRSQCSCVHLHAALAVIHIGESPASASSPA